MGIFKCKSIIYAANITKIRPKLEIFNGYFKNTKISPD